MRILAVDEVKQVSGGDTDYGPIVACTVAGTVGIAFGAMTGGPVGAMLAYFGALSICNSGGGSGLWSMHQSFAMY